MQIIYGCAYSSFIAGAGHTGRGGLAWTGQFSANVFDLAIRSSGGYYRGGCAHAFHRSLYVIAFSGTPGGSLSRWGGSGEVPRAKETNSSYAVIFNLLVP